MPDPLGHIECRSQFLIPVRLSFDIVLDDDIVHVSYSNLPKKDEPWYGHHESSKYGSGCFPLKNVENGQKALPKAVAEALCVEIGAGKPKRIQNVVRNYVDLFVPKLIQLSQIQPNYPEKRTDIRRVVGYVMFADLRGFSNWSLNAAPEQISEMYEVISDRIAQMVIDYPFDYWKLLGDGVMLVWESNDDGSQDADCAIDAAYELHKKYGNYRRDLPYELPEGFGIAICGGYLTRFLSSTFFDLCLVRDYLGPVANQAARLQSLAKPGEVLVNKWVAKKSKFDWHSFEDVTDSMKDKLEGLKGLSTYEKSVFRVKHKYFD